MLKPQVLRLSKNTLIYGVGSLLNRFIGFLLLPVFTAYLTPKDYGISSILGWVAFFVTPVFSLGLGAAIAPCYFEGEKREQKDMTIWTAFTLLIVSASFLAILGIVFAPSISRLAFQTPEYRYLVTISLLTTCLSILSTPFMLYLQFEERAKLFVVLSGVTTLTSISLNFLMVVVLGKGIRGLIEAGFIAQPITLTLFLWPALSEIRFRFSVAQAKELLRLGIPLIPSFAFLFVLQHGNKYLLQWFDGLGTLGIYSVGFNLGLMMALLVSAFQSAWVPFFMSFVDKREEARILFGRILTYYILGFGTLSLLFFATARPVVMLMTQPAFRDAYKVVGFSACTQFMTGVFYILLPGMYFAKDVRYVSVIQGAAAILSLSFSLLLIPTLGLLGAGIATSLGFLVMVVLTQLWNWKRRQSYLDVQYELKRVLWFAIIYVGYVAIMLLERDLSLLGELTFSFVTMMIVLVAVFTLLHPSERGSVWRLRGMFHRKSPIEPCTKV